MPTESRNKTSFKNLARQLKEGNRLAFTTLYEDQWDTLFQAAYKVLRDTDLAKDVVQEVFFDLWTRRAELEIANLSGYLYQAVKFQSLKQLRKARMLDIHEEHFQEALQVNDAEEQINLNQLQESLTASLEGLPEKYRTVFELSRVQHLSNKEIAEKLGISHRTVDWYIHNVLKHLRKSLVTALVIFTGHPPF